MIVPPDFMKDLPQGWVIIKPKCSCKIVNFMNQSFLMSDMFNSRRK